MKSAVDLQRWLEEATPVVVGAFLIAPGSVKQCGHVSNVFGAWSAELGFDVLVYAAPGHFFNIFQTTDGPIAVDMTAVQFEVPQRAATFEPTERDPFGERRALRAIVAELRADPARAITVSPARAFIGEPPEPSDISFEAARFVAEDDAFPDGFPEVHITMSRSDHSRPPRRNGSDALADFEREYKTMMAIREKRRQVTAEMLARSPVVRESHGRRELALVTSEMSNPEEGAFRVTFFLEDGPRGHRTRKTMDAIVDTILEEMTFPLESASEADLLELQASATFQQGAAIMAFQQADAILRYAERTASSELAGRIDRALRKANDRAGGRTTDDYEAATAILAEVIRTLPTPNPVCHPCVRNPAWVTTAVADSFETIDDVVPGKWMPQFNHVLPKGKNTLTARLTEYGCGAYGCVLATLDPDTVLKVTSDPTEAEFAAQLAPTLVAPIAVDYRMVVRLAGKRHGRPIHLLWRESATDVGKLADYVKPATMKLVDAQHAAAQAMYDALYDGKNAVKIRVGVERWIASVRKLRVDPALELLAVGLEKVYDKQRIVFGDLHDGNLGRCIRNGEPTWVITDPGHVAVIED